MRLFVDANIFLYAIGAESPHREPSRALLAAVSEGRLEGVTSSEVLQEILHVRTRRVGIADATTAVRAAADLVADVLAVAKKDVLDACDLIKQYPALGARDALHAAVMMNAGMHLLVSVDRDFDLITSLKRIDATEALTWGAGK